MSRKLYLLDGMALLYRAHFAFVTRPIINSKGINTSAIMGFANTLLDLLNKQQPSHLAVALDTSAPTERHQIFPAYKAQRDEMPQDLSIAIPKAIELLKAMNIPLLALDGYEADDIIGTLAHQAAKDGFQTYMVTSDKDFGQLVDENTFIYEPAKGGGSAQILGVSEVCAKWGIIRPDQVTDILALMGDSADNIPGVPGIGPKTAQKLITEFDNLENLIANREQLKGKNKELLTQHADQALLCKKLATINCQVPLTTKPDELQRREKNEPALVKLLDELELKALAKRLLNKEYVIRQTPASPADKPQNDANDKPFTLDSSPIQKRFAKKKTKQVEEPAEPLPIYKTIKDVPHNYESVMSAEQRAKWLKKLANAKAFAFDTETSSLDPHSAVLLGLSFCCQEGEACFVHLPAEKKAALEILAEFAPLFANNQIEKIGHNLKFDLRMLSAHGLAISGPFFDTMVAHSLIELERRHNLNNLAEAYLGYSPITIESLAGDANDELNMLAVDKEKLAEYGAEDADIAWQLREKFAPLLASHNLEKVFYQVEMPLLPTLMAMETAGVYIDIFALEHFSGHLAIEIDKAAQDLYRLAGHKFNLNSPKQLGIVLFEELKIVERPKRTKTGQYTTNEQVLQSLRGAHKIVERLLDYRQATKLKSTYVDALPALISNKTGRLHTTYHQASTATGRLASVNPNLQNIPIRSEMGREIRKAFIADPRLKDMLILSADYSQIELRIIAALSRDEAMLAAFDAKHDIHAATAARVFGVAISDVTDDMRRKAKMVNFGIAYGISAFGLAQRLDIPRGEAAEIIAEYNRQFSGIKTYMDNTLELCRQHGYVETVTGRRRYIRDINDANATIRNAAERNAINMPIQGSAADMIKIAMTNIQQALTANSLRTKLLLQVHDELVLELYQPEEAQIRKLVEEKMKTAIELPVPIEVEIGTGKNWLDAH